MRTRVEMPKGASDMEPTEEDMMSTCVVRTRVLQMPKGASDMEIPKTCVRTHEEIVTNASSTPLRSTLMDELSESVELLKVRNKALVGRLQEIEAALVTKGSIAADVSTYEGVASIPEPFPEPPRAASALRSR